MYAAFNSILAHSFAAILAHKRTHAFPHANTFSLRKICIQVAVFNLFVKSASSLCLNF